MLKYNTVVSSVYLPITNIPAALSSSELVVCITLRVFIILVFHCFSLNFKQHGFGFISKVYTNNLKLKHIGSLFPKNVF